MYKSDRYSNFLYNLKVKQPDSDEDVDDDSDSDDGDTATCADMDDVAKDLRIHSKDEAAFAAFMTGATRSVGFMVALRPTVRGVGL